MTRGQSRRVTEWMEGNTRSRGDTTAASDCKDGAAMAQLGEGGGGPVTCAM